MKHTNKFFRNRWWSYAMFALLFFSLSAFLSQVHAQSTANYAFSTNTTGSLGLDMNGNTVDMSTGTTQVLAVNTSQDQSINAGAIAFPAGFDFFFGGNRFNSYFATSNGIVQLGNTAVVVGSTYSAGGGSLTAPRFSAFDGDLGTGTTGGIFGKMVGTAPNRCYVIEFRNMTLMWTTAYTNDGTYQVRFYENTGVVEYVYGGMNITSTGSASDATPEVGFSWGSLANQSLSVNISTSAVDLSGTMVQNTVTAGTVANLNSTAEGTRRVYRFTPPLTTAPSALSFTSVTGSSMTLNWTDNATNELAFAIYRSTDGINYTYAGAAAANATTFNATGLSFGTTYFWNVYAVTEGALSTPALNGSQATIAGTLSGIKTVGTGGDYNNLTTAFAAINASGLAGNVDLQLITGYPAAPETYPIQSSNTGAVGSFNVKVYPMVSGLSITSNNTTGTLNLNNAKNITFDGRVNQAGPNDLIISNTNAGTSYAILFNNDASNNILQNCIVQSTNTSTTSGTIVFGTTTGANGNDNNTVTACDIRDGATTPVNAIYSVGTTTTPAQFNDNNVISNNNISNYFSAGSATVGIFVGGGNSTWTISNNKLFQTATRTYTTGNTHNGIQINSTTGSGFVVSGNTIGFASSTGTGVYTLAGTVATRFIGINMAAGTSTVSSIQGNTVSGISLSTSSGATTANGIIAGINVTSGNVNVGTVTPNTIGSGTGTGSINASTSTVGGLVVGINTSSAGTVVITNNIIGSITATGTTATSPSSITGIQASAGTNTINNNTIGSTVTANSINASTVATSGGQIVNGINVTSGVSLATSIQSNVISNLTQAGTTTTGLLRGIVYSGTGIATISQNTISVLTGANANTALAAAGIQGILHNGTATGGGTISNNTIHTLIGSNTGAVQSNVNGVGIVGLSNATVSRNRIYNLQNASTGVTATTPPTASGIMVRSIGAGSSINNNMISLGNAQTSNTEFVGIWNNVTSTNPINVYYNTVNIEGAVGTGALPTFGFLRGDNSGTAITSTVDVRNNIFNNMRTGGTSKGYAIANQSTAANATGWGLNASNFNALNTSNTATVGLWGSTDLDFITWRTTASSDANSFSAIPVTFANTATGDLHLNMGATATPIESGGATIATITTDFDSQNRPGPTGSVNGGATAPDLGADEFDGVPALPVITLNSVTPPASTQCTASSRLVSVNITTPVGTVTSAFIGYTMNGVPQAAIAMTNTSGTTWQGTIPAASPVNATIVWGVSATNSAALSSSINGTTYADEPLFGYTTSAQVSSSTVCSGSPTSLTGLLNNPAASTLYTTPSIGNPTTDEDLRTVRITQGASTLLNNTSAANSLTGTLGTATGTAGSYSNFTSFGSTTLAGGQTYSLFVASIDPASPYYTNFATAFIDYNRDGDFADAGESIIPTTGQLLNATVDNGNDSITVNFTVPASAINGLTRMRVVITETGQTNAAGSTNNSYGEFEDYAILISGATPGSTSNITSVTWMNGATTVGTGNPLTVNPTTTTTYTANITAFGCVASPAPAVTVTVNPLPATPTAANSAQCGTQVPTASVTSTSGLPTPTFNWYAAASGGTALQSSTSTTYTTAVSTTTTFYVSELNTVTGCESARVAVTVNVSSPDNILAATSSATVCVGSPVTLTVSNTNPTPFQTYTYTWTNAQAGSGLTSATGASQTITPTQTGSFTYNVTGVDGGCTAVSSIAVTVTPYTATLTPINITCNGANNGSFSVASQSCGTANLYAVDGGAFGPLPTNLTPGSHTVIVQNTGGYQTAPISITITQPAAVPAPLGISNATICQGNPSATLTVPASGTISVTASFGLVAQPAVIGTSTAPTTTAANPNVIATATLPALPSGATITNVSFNMNGLTPIGGSWGSDVFFGFSGAYSANYASGTGAPTSATAFNYNRVFTGGTYNPAGGSVSLHYYDQYDDNTGAECTFPIGASVGTLTITYSYTNPSVNWYSASTGGTLQGTGTPFQTVGTTVLPNTNTPGTYTFFAEGTNGTCTSATRTPVTVTVKPTSTSTTTVSACGSYTWTNGTTYTTSGTYTRTLTNYLGCDSIATLALTIKLPTTATQTVSACSSYTWPVNGTTYTTSGAYTHTLVGANAAGCDSTITLNLTIKLPTTSTQSASACVSYTWPVNGTTYTTSGAYTHTLIGANAVGCDSTITLNLTINQPTTATQTASACSSYTWAVNGMTYNTSGAYTHTLIGANAAGCDSTITLNLTINQPTTGVDVQTACDSYTWIDGVTYTASNNTATFTLTNAAGCDSVVTLNLTLNNSTTGTDVQTACDSYTWIDGITYTASNNSATFTLTNAAGCDSVVTLNLTINNSTTGSESATACGSYTWATDGNTYTTSGSYTATLVNAAGCDSIVTLNLTINNSTTGTDVQTACDSYTWIDGITYTASNNTATFTLTNAAGCDSIVTLNLTINATPTATATDNGDATITAGGTGSYQWIDCATGAAIAGVTNATYTVTANGSYAVIVSNGSCVDTSACVLIDYIGIKENVALNISVFPNPTNSDVTVTFSATAAAIEVLDAQGKILQTVNVKSGDQISLANYQTGVYFIKVSTANGSKLERVVKN